MPIWTRLSLRRSVLVVKRTAWLLVLLVATGTVGAGTAHAAGLCNSTITTSKKLHHNVHCSSFGITIGADNVVLNLNGFTLSGTQGPMSYGIFTTGHTGITIKNGTVKRFQNGIILDTTTNSTVSRIHANRNGQNGIVIQSGSTGITVNHSSAAHNITDGFDIKDSPNNTIKNSTAYRNTQDGFDVTGTASTGNTLTGDHAAHNIDYGYLVELDPSSTTLDDDVATNNINDGINIDNPDTSNQVSNSTANFNLNDGIRAGDSAQDGNGNHAHGNGGSEQCLNVVC